MQTATTLRKGDLVQVMLGRARGKTGKILTVDYRRARVLIDKVNMVKRRMKPSRAQPQGGMVEKEASVHWSNVMMVCPKCVKPVRVRSRKTADGKTGRHCVKCNEKVGA